MPRVYRYGPHPGEEPPLSGSRGSGTIFFSHCTLRCLYCQNHPWSQGRLGAAADSDRLAAMLKDLASRGCHNWNLVTPTPWLPWIAAGLRQAKRDGVSLPVVYNTSGFELPDALEQYAQTVDIALVDLRYASSALAGKASDCAEYVRYARRTMRWFWERLGPLVTDADGCARRGLICRILVLPGHAAEAVRSLRWLASQLGTDVAVSLMAQYTPAYRAREAGTPWNRRLTRAEYEPVVRELERLGLSTGWVQEPEDAPPEELLGSDMPPGAPRD